MTPSTSSVLELPRANERVFFPFPDAFSPVFPVETGEATLACAYHQPFPEAGTVVVFHGNGEVVSDYFPSFARELEALGYNCLVASYRGYGPSSGRPSLGALLRDVLPVVEATERPPEQVVLFGRSLGSLPALYGASQRKSLGGLILESAVADWGERFQRRFPSETPTAEDQALQEALRKALPLEQMMGEFQGPVLILHALQDSLVDLTHATRLHTWSSRRATLIVLPEGDHNSVRELNREDYYTALQSFLMETSLRRHVG